MFWEGTTMITTTLILTRLPNDEFTHPSLGTGYRGRFGTLIALQGPKLSAVQAVPSGSVAGTSAIKIPSGSVLDIKTSAPGDIREIDRFTTIERLNGMVQLPPQYRIGNKAYGLEYEPTNPVVIKLKSTGGKCFHVRGGLTHAQRGILIHEAPHVGWLEGCIGPRRLGDKSKDDRAADSAKTAMNVLFSLHPKPSELWVLDW